MARSNAPHQPKSDIDSQSQSTSAVEGRIRGINAKRLRLAQLQVGFAFSAFILIGANEGALGVLIPSMRLHYGVDKATIGLLFLFQTIGYLIAAFNSGLLVEKLGNRRFLVLGVASFLLGVGALSLMPSFVIVLIMMLPLGFGVAIIDAGLNIYIASMPRNAALLNYLHAFYGTGALLGPVISSAFLAMRWGWNSVYIVWIGMSLVLLIGFQLVFKEQNISLQENVTTKPKSNVLVAALRVPIVWIAALFMLIYVGAEVSVGSWSYSFLTEERHASILLAGWMVSGYWIGLTLGRLTLARVALRVGSARLIQGCLVGVVVGVLLVWLLPFYAVSAVGLGLIGFSFGPIYPTTIALISNKVSSRLLPSAIGFMVSLGSVGAAICPWLAGMLAEHVGLLSLMPYVIILTAVMVCLWQALQIRPRVPHMPLEEPGSSAVDAPRYRALGKLIDVGGYRLHINCIGTGSPTVILDAGLGGSSLDWSLVQPGVATFTRVCSYDRAGYGWSDSSPKSRTSGRIVAELHTLLIKAGIPGPYILVGQSFGGLNVRLYAYTYPQEVVGMVLVDASHEDAFVRFPTLQQELLDGQKQLSMCSGLASFGVIRLFGFLDKFILQYPSAVQPQVKTQIYQTRFCGTWYDEGASWDESTTQVHAARTQHSLGQLPLVVITRGEQVDASWQILQKDLASLSSNSTHIIATHSGHDIMFERPDLVIAAIKQVVTGQKM